MDIAVWSESAYNAITASLNQAGPFIFLVMASVIGVALVMRLIGIVVGIGK